MLILALANKLKLLQKTYTQCGTEGYIAPEILNNFGHDLSWDIYSFGILILSMMAGYVPNTESKMQKAMKMLSGSLEAKDLVVKWLNSYPDQRPTVESIMKHKLFKNIDWENVKNQSYQPFFIPELNDEFDTKYFK